jgi:tetratricopeptide (TPR) repeat protein
MADKAIEAYQQIYGAESPQTLNGMSGLVTVLYNLGRLQEAEAPKVQVLGTAKRVLGVEHSDTLISMDTLASTFRHLGQLKEAEELGLQALESAGRCLA